MTIREPNILEKFKAAIDFANDGCTMAPDLTFSHCCYEHDIYYVTGAISRAEADRCLRKCISARGYPVLAWVYWLGVRLFGWFFFYFGKVADFREDLEGLEIPDEVLLSMGCDCGGERKHK
jgi:hypothetical protein